MTDHPSIELQSLVPPSVDRNTAPPIVKAHLEVLIYEVITATKILLSRPPEVLAQTWAKLSINIRGSNTCELIVVRLREDYKPPNSHAAREAWQACFRVLRRTFGPQFCFSFQVGRTKHRNWCFPKVIWLRGILRYSIWKAYNPWDRCRLEHWITETRKAYKERSEFTPPRFMN
ncbi:hypothetical protein RRF57_004711 [Xylaria bambusicola]|uniref:Uncharacterized protein n=1 Tax=Xylaria bambusicola TaxID=326684 RepID=A0AAN7UM96_9PEZI